LSSNRGEVILESYMQAALTIDQTKLSESRIELSRHDRDYFGADGRFFDRIGPLAAW